MMLLVAFKNCDTGIPVHFCPDGSVFNLRRLQAHTKTLSAVTRELLYADDCALLAHTLSYAQQLFDRFREAACRFNARYLADVKNFGVGILSCHLTWAIHHKHLMWNWSSLATCQRYKTHISSSLCSHPCIKQFRLQKKSNPHVGQKITVRGNTLNRCISS